MPTKISFDEAKIKHRIAAAFLALTENDEVSNDIAFHMTDWLADIEELHTIYSNIDNFDDEQITDFMYRFLAHVPNHLNAARKLSGIGGVTDVFGLGILSDKD